MSDDAYSGVFGAFPYAFRNAESRLFRAYAVVGTLVALLVALAFLVSLMLTLSDTLGGSVGTFSFVRAFVIFVGLLVVGPLIAPILSVARRRRTGRGDVTYEKSMGALGFAFVASLYVMLVISAPAQYRDPPPAVLAPLVEFLYGLHSLVGLVPPVAIAVAMYLVHRRLR